jgi:hypothetical protein
MPETNATLERAIDQGTIDLETGEFPLVLATKEKPRTGTSSTSEEPTSPNRFHSKSTIRTHRSRPSEPSSGSVEEPSKVFQCSELSDGSSWKGKEPKRRSAGTSP